jgi:polysaccharide biosynthesis transport protein
VHSRPMSALAEAARSIRTNLMFMNPDRPYRKLLVTSAAPSEGKTTVVCSIAIALAQGGQRVCVVDCDLRRPRLHRIFGRTGEAGVTNVLVGDATIDDVAKPTGIGNLWAIPAGPMPPNPADVLHSERFRKFMQDLADRFDRVIIDSPPIVAVTDSAIISTLVDGTVFVVRAFQTSKHLSAQGLRTLRDVDAPVVGAVLNAVDLNRHEGTYYYNYYYYRREGAYRSPPPDEQRDDEAPPVAPPH